MSIVKRVIALAGWTCLSFATVILLAATVPNLLGYRSLTVLSGSMEPTLDTGDMVVSKWIQPDQARVGDIVTFKSSQSNKLITHRVRSVAVEGNRVSMVTKGDANDTVERWQAPRDGRVSRVAYDIPKLGYLTNWIKEPHGRILLVVIPALLLAIFELVSIWRPQDRRDPTPETLGDART